MTQANPMEDLIERLGVLEYAIRQAMTVREDQDEPAEPQHLAEAAQFGIAVDDAMTKGDLLNAVQTLHRASQKNAGQANKP
ncbi:MAG: hypothetical protein K2Y13_15270 [Burkholderiaceae bacterium]|uniref:Uncharacterized protein n=1 Tax=Herminiimonas contaminans TaxID=1111140 RepID=A0ABS0ET68_9BURK|nr:MULTISPECIES: hypothetical protein [Oxalobacteraceae]MBF8178035.1 hypothetical protein [Herminiimonas contaminans]MBX9800817.1 hypothetical protein [Burkholderiaceae bacterium]